MFLMKLVMVHVLFVPMDAGLEFILVSRADTRLLCSLALHGLHWTARPSVMRSSVSMVKFCKIEAIVLTCCNERQNSRIAEISSKFAEISLEFGSSYSIAAMNPEV